MAKKKTIVSGNIAPLNTNCIAIHSMSFNEAERRLDVTLKTDNQLFPFQDFRFEWDDDEEETFYTSAQLCKDPKAPNGQAWWEFDLDDEMPEPKNANDLTRQRKYIDKNLICHWGGERANAGKKGPKSAQVSSSVPQDVLEVIRKAAESENSSISAKICQILKNWAKRQKKD